MKIIKKDNYNRDHISESVLAENVHPHFAKDIAEFLNQKMRNDDSFFCQVEADDYVPYQFEP